MRILHVWDQAGVACVLAKYQRLEGHTSSVIRVSDYDRYGINSFYDDYIIFSSSQHFLERTLKEAENADIIHVHSRSDLVINIRQKFDRSKKIILHFHGTDIRGLKKRKVTNELAQNEISSNLSNFVSKSKVLAKDV